MVWPISFLTNMLTALKGSQFYFFFYFFFYFIFILFYFYSISLQIMMSVRWSMFVAMAPVQITLAASAVIVPKGSFQDHMKSVKVNKHEHHI